MSAVVRTNAQWWVLIPLSLHGCSQRQQSEAHIATALTADWTRGVLGPLAGATTASCLLGSATLLSLLLSPTRLWGGNLQARRSRAAMTGGSSTSPYSVRLWVLLQRDMWKANLAVRVAQKTEDKADGGGNRFITSSFK